MILREIVIKHHLNGSSEREIARKVFIPRTSVRCIIAKYKFAKCIGNITHRGRKSKTTSSVDRCMRRKIMTHRRISSSQTKAELQSDLNVALSESTVKRWAREAGLFGQVVRNRPYVNKINRAKRLEYARIY